MSRITDPPVFVPGTVADTDALADFFYAPPLSQTLSVINGELDEANILNATNDKLYGYDVIQKGALSGGGGIGGTANLDFFSGGSGKVGTKTWNLPLGAGFYRSGNALEIAERYLPIPGGAVQFYLPYKARVLILWSVTFTNDNNLPVTANDSDYSTSVDLTWSQINLFIDGSPTGPDVEYSAQASRVCYGAMGDEVNSTYTRAYLTDPHLQDRYKARTWSGHYFADELDIGYHSASLRVCAANRVKQTRVRARSIKYIYFKHGGT
ncbi:MAG: hypothetical protein Tp1123DCM257201_9 [Prokaryotic dsDNA virus sp.]|nr:MAG: hypothetical protein Tp1123DCM257201_9 [Prokaryotic dsDNA virus sp.]